MCLGCLCLLVGAASSSRVASSSRLAVSSSHQVAETNSSDSSIEQLARSNEGMLEYSGLTSHSRTSGQTFVDNRYYGGNKDQNVTSNRSALGHHDFKNHSRIAGRILVDNQYNDGDAGYSFGGKLAYVRQATMQNVLAVAVIVAFLGILTIFITYQDHHHEESI
mmetsp:Transcript_49743/g.79090  ORF Transcript_49743/g.79090 Transcript_49743/m.79090 type:complete len:164 (+) Transcript_49743:40-531(+)